MSLPVDDRIRVARETENAAREKERMRVSFLSIPFMAFFHHILALGVTVALGLGLPQPNKKPRS